MAYKRKKSVKVRSRTMNGTFKLKENTKYVGSGAVIYESSYELASFMYCERDPVIVSWVDEPDLQLKYFFDGKMRTYFVDLMIEIQCEDGEIRKYLVEVKPNKEVKPPKPSKNAKSFKYETETYNKNLAKWKACHKFAQSKGWGFAIWDENVLAPYLKEIKIVSNISKGKRK